MQSVSRHSSYLYNMTECRRDQQPLSCNKTVNCNTPQGLTNVLSSSVIYQP